MGACGSTPKVLKDDALLAPEVKKEPEKDIIIEAEQPKNEPTDGLKDNVEVIDQSNNKVEGDNVIETIKAIEDNEDKKNDTTNDINTIASEPIATEVEQEESKPENVPEDDQEKTSQKVTASDDQEKTSQKVTASDDNAKVEDVGVPKTEESNIAETSAQAETPKKNGFPDIGNTFRSMVSNITKGLNNNK